VAVSNILSPIALLAQWDQALDSVVRIANSKTFKALVSVGRRVEWIDILLDAQSFRILTIGNVEIVMPKRRP
jgi:hypothetical protein